MKLDNKSNISTLLLYIDIIFNKEITNITLPPSINQDDAKNKLTIKNYNIQIRE